MFKLRDLNERIDVNKGDLKISEIEKCQKVTRGHSKEKSGRGTNLLTEGIVDEDFNEMFVVKTLGEKSKVHTVISN